MVLFNLIPKNTIYIQLRHQLVLQLGNKIRVSSLEI